MRSRSRSCNNPSPSNGGRGCQGYDTYLYRCSGGSCPSSSTGQWGSWSSWTTCGSNCMRSRSRSCNGSGCQGYATYAYSCSGGSCSGKTECNLNEIMYKIISAPTDSQWGSWSSYTTCGSNCLRSRSRSCTGSACQGYPTYFYSCTGGSCTGILK